MTWPALFLWTVTLALAVVVARPGLRARHRLLGLAPLVALCGLGLWLAYLVLDGSIVLSWVALGVAMVGALLALLDLVSPDAGPASVVDVVVWGANGTLLVAFAFTAVLCFFAGLGYQGPGS